MKQLLEVLVKQNLKHSYSEDFIDLGLPSGIKWASKNLGAKTPEDIGDYYTWGDIKPTEKMASYENYVFCNNVSSLSPHSKYNHKDNLCELEDVDNAVKYTLGKEFDMPTEDDLNELLENTNQEVIEIKNTKFVKCMSNKTSNYILIPYGGLIGRHQDDPKKVGDSIRIWAKTIAIDDDESGVCLKNNIIGNEILTIGYPNRILGLNIRAIQR